MEVSTIIGENNIIEEQVNNMEDNTFKEQRVNDIKEKKYKKKNNNNIQHINIPLNSIKLKQCNNKKNCPNIQICTFIHLCMPYVIGICDNTTETCDYIHDSKMKNIIMKKNIIRIDNNKYYITSCGQGKTCNNTSCTLNHVCVFKFFNGTCKLSAVECRYKHNYDIEKTIDNSSINNLSINNLSINDNNIEKTIDNSLINNENDIEKTIDNSSINNENDIEKTIDNSSINDNKKYGTDNLLNSPNTNNDEDYNDEVCDDYCEECCDGCKRITEKINIVTHSIQNISNCQNDLLTGLIKNNEIKISNCVLEIKKVNDNHNELVVLFNNIIKGFNTNDQQQILIIQQLQEQNTTQQQQLYIMDEQNKIQQQFINSIQEQNILLKSSLMIDLNINEQRFISQQNLLQYKTNINEQINDYNHSSQYKYQPMFQPIPIIKKI